MTAIWGMLLHVSKGRHTIPASATQNSVPTGSLMAEHLIFLTSFEAKPQIDRPAPDRLIAGDPVFTTWNHTDRDGLFCGIWQGTPGKWRVDYTEWEYCHILAGISVLTSATRVVRTVRAGDRFIIEPGFTGTWEVVETTRKDYVIRV